MISRITIQNFLSLKDVDVKLGKLNVLIGPNAAGKSNFVKALMLLRNTALVGYPVLDERAIEIPFTDMVYNHDNRSNIKIRVEIPSNDTAVAYEIQLNIEGYEEKVYSDNKEIYYRDQQLRKAYYTTSTGSLKEIITMPTKRVDLILRHRHPRILGVLDRTSVTFYESLLKNPPSDANTPIHTISDVLKRIGIFRLDSTQMRTTSSVMEAPIIGYRGENLARYLLYLYLESPEDYHRIEEVIKSLIPEVEKLVPHLEGTNVELWARIRGLDFPLRPEFISDGTIRLAAISMVLYSGLSVVAIEEPENHVHPYLLEALVDLARRCPSQVIFTTHSPHLLDYVKPEEVYLVSKVGTETRIKRLADTDEIERVRRFLEEGGTLGEAWFSRLFGE